MSVAAQAMVEIQARDKIDIVLKCLRVVDRLGWLNQLVPGVVPQEENDQAPLLAPAGDPQNLAELRRILLGLYPLIQDGQRKNLMTPYAIIPWRKVLLDEEFYRHHIKVRMFGEGLANWADTGMTVVYFLFNVLGLTLSVLSLQGQNIPHFTTALFNTWSGQSWNDFDVGGGLVLGAFQWWHDEKLLGGLNIFSAVQLAALTVTALFVTSLAVYFVGFSFAGAMLIPCIIESIEAWRANKQTQELRAQQRECNELGEDDSDIAKKIRISEANYRNHAQNAWSWMGCFLAMSAITTVAVLTGLSGGIFPIVVAAIGIVIAVARVILTKKMDHIAALAPTTKTYQDQATTLFKGLQFPTIPITPQDANY